MLSVIVPVYNSEDYLDKCVESILAQSYNNLELILVDDGSTDTSGNMCDFYAKKHFNIKAIHSKNTGPGAARNVGIDVSRGDYISFVDADDYIEKDMYEKMVAEGEKTCCEVVICDYFQDYEDENRRELVSFDIPAYKSLDENAIKQYIVPQMLNCGENGGLCNKIYRSDFLKRLKLQGISIDTSLDYGEDHFFLMEMFVLIKKIIYIKEPFYHYVHRKNSSLTKKKRDLSEQLKIAYNFYSNRLVFAKNFDANTEELEKAYFNKLIKIYLYNMQNIDEKLFEKYLFYELQKKYGIKNIKFKTFIISFFIKRKDTLALKILKSIAARRIVL